MNSFALVPKADRKLLKSDLLPLEASFYYAKRGVKAVRVPIEERSADGASKAIFLHRDGNAAQMIARTGVDLAHRLRRGECRALQLTIHSVASVDEGEILPVVQSNLGVLISTSLIVCAARRGHDMKKFMGFQRNDVAGRVRYEFAKTVGDDLQYCDGITRGAFTLSSTQFLVSAKIYPVDNANEPRMR